MPRSSSLWNELTWAYPSQLVTDALTRCGGNVNAAATLLEIRPSTLHRFLRLHPGQGAREEV